MADAPAPNADPPTPAPLAKPAAPAAQTDPPGIADSVMKKDAGAARTLSDTAEQARREEELEALDNLPTAAGED